ncbi:MAG: recombinase family protein [Planctomycetaceae bacterium]
MFESEMSDLLKAEMWSTEQKMRSFRAKEAWKQRKAKMKEIVLTPAVAYIRASLLQRNTQRERIEAYAQNHRFKIVRTYEDVGTSGRQQYRRMVAHAGEGDFTAILCMDLSHFGRIISFRHNQEMKCLRDAGVKLHSVLDGEIEWTTHNGLLVQPDSSRP